MTLPYRKLQEGSISSPVEPKKVGDEYGTLDAICEDCMHAFEHKDIKVLKAALQALIDHIQDVDEEQDKDEFQPKS